MEDSTSSGCQSTGQQIPDAAHCRSQHSRPLREESQSGTKEPTMLVQSDQTGKTSSNARQAKLLATIENLKSSISTTEAQLSIKLREITKLESFPISTSNKNNRESIQSQYQQISAPETSQTHQDSSFSSSMSREDEKAALAHAHSIINGHISLLKSYNEIKNIAMGMLGLIADKEGRRLKDVMDERGVEVDD